jgi:hypothetical protein
LPGVLPKASASNNNPSSPAETALGMAENIGDSSQMSSDEQLNVLNELCVEHISFAPPALATQMIAALGGIINSNPNPTVRAKALEAMQRIITLEEKAEAERGKPAIDWPKVNALLLHAKRQMGSAAGRPDPRGMNTPQPVAVDAKIGNPTVPQSPSRPMPAPAEE